ncbi:MAG: endonuclease/exonuclease/phosphatase family protein [Microcoleaceae cyanobacterium]
MRRLFTVFLFVLTSLVGCQSDQDLTVVGFNVESGDADPEFIANRYIKPINQAELWGFSEVKDQTWVDQFVLAARNQPSGLSRFMPAQPMSFRSIFGSTGNSDRLAILYDSTQLEQLESYELETINIGGRVRAPLVAQFRFKPTGTEFLFVVNHLYRTDAAGRHRQAQLLNQWAQQQSLPIVAVGDYNFDWDVVRGENKRDKGYDLMTQNGVFTWIRPTNLVATYCSKRYSSILDFVFVAGGAKNWPASAEVLYPEAEYCPDDQRKSDHRPMQATFQIPE